MGGNLRNKRKWKKKKHITNYIKKIRSHTNQHAMAIKDALQNPSVINYPMEWEEFD
jgi:hypothetical protein